MPSSATFRGWAARVPSHFTFAVKASRYLTHIRRLDEPRQPVAYLMERTSELGSQLGPILLQLPPDMPADLDRLARTLEAFPRTVRVAIEPRHPSWYTDAFRQLLTERGVALCLADRRGPLMPAWATTDWAYLRFHGGRAQPPSCYSERALARWVDRIRDVWGPDPSGYAYFNNDHMGCALRDAAVLGRLLEKDGIAVARRPAITDEVLRVLTPPAAR